MVPNEIIYADDCDFISANTYADIDKVEPVLGKDSLHMGPYQN